MPDKKNMSVADILAACRKTDLEGGGGTLPESAPADSREEPVTAAGRTTGQSDSAPTEPATLGKEPGPMSVTEILAAARAGKPRGVEAKAPAKAASPAAKPEVAGRERGGMSVADILAAARGGGKGGGTAPAAEKVKAEPVATPKAAAKAAASGPRGAKDTASILAAARSAARPGPISKAEATSRAAEAPAARPVQRDEPAAKPAERKLGIPPMPAKPDYAKPGAAATRPAEQDRRGFFAALAGVFVGSSLAVGFTSLTVTHLLWLLGCARFMFPNILTEPPTKFKVGFPDELSPGQVETKYQAQFGVWIVRYEYEGQPQIYALQTVCTHLGCTPNWLEAEQKFKCPCHGSGFYKDGINFEGPAPRPLERYAIRIADDGQLEVDKSRRFQEELGQWRDPTSFVPV